MEQKVNLIILVLKERNDINSLGKALPVTSVISVKFSDNRLRTCRLPIEPNPISSIFRRLNYAGLKQMIPEILQPLPVQGFQASHILFC